MTESGFTILGVGNILEMDDGIAVYATSFLEQNYSFAPPVDIINGGVEGINLLNLFIESERILILDAIDIDDETGSIYHIPSHELSGFGVNSGGAHEVGVMQCIDMLELMDKPQPKSSVVGIVPETVKVHIGLSPTLQKAFSTYIETIIKIVEDEGIIATKRGDGITLESVINRFKNPERRVGE
ncbi:MAG: hydrogenase maturation protease [Helicobacteraceae bacterium]|jgi:hydrogenase maturation protease|nr:hydrogenase maturation protease [Helicobacteraceae bacterium]